MNTKNLFLFVTMMLGIYLSSCTEELYENNNKNAVSGLRIAVTDASGIGTPSAANSASNGVLGGVKLPAQPIQAIPRHSKLVTA